MSEETTTDAAREKFTPKQHAGETVGEWLESLPSERRMQMLAGDDIARLTIALGKEFEIAERAAIQQGRAQGLLEAAEIARGWLGEGQLPGLVERLQRRAEETGEE